MGGNQLEVCTAALSTEFSYNDEETLISASPKILIHGFDELIPKLIALGIMSEPGVRN